MSIVYDSSSPQNSHPSVANTSSVTGDTTAELSSRTTDASAAKGPDSTPGLYEDMNDIQAAAAAAPSSPKSAAGPAGSQGAMANKNTSPPSPSAVSNGLGKDQSDNTYAEIPLSHQLQQRRDATTSSSSAPTSKPPVVSDQKTVPPSSVGVSE